MQKDWAAPGTQRQDKGQSTTWQCYNNHSNAGQNTDNLTRKGGEESGKQWEENKTQLDTMKQSKLTREQEKVGNNMWNGKWTQRFLGTGVRYTQAMTQTINNVAGNAWFESFLSLICLFFVSAIMTQALLYHTTVNRQWVSEIEILSYKVLIPWVNTLPLAAVQTAFSLY